MTPPVAIPPASSSIAARVRLRVGGRVVGEHRAQAGLERARRDDVNRDLGEARRLARREDDVVVVRQHDGLRRARALDRLEQLLGRRVHRLAAVDDPGRAHALEEPAVALAGDDRDDRRPRDRRRPGCESRSSRWAVCSCMFAISTRSMTPSAVPARSAAPGSSVWTWALSAARVADDEQRVAERRELALESLAFEPLALDDEARAVAVARSLLVHGVRARAARLDGLGERLAREVRRDSADDLDEARPRPRRRRPPSGVRRAGPASARQPRRRGDERGEQLRELVVPARSASSASSRTTVRIVPSTGSRTAA